MSYTPRLASGHKSIRLRPASTASTTGSRDRPRVIGDGVAWSAKWCARGLLIAAALTVLGYVVGLAWSILLPVVLALLVASVLERPTRLVEERLHVRPTLAAAVVLVLSILLVAGVLAAISPSIAGQSTDIARDASSGLQQLQDWGQSTGLISGTQIDHLIQAAQDKLNSSGGAIASGAVSGLSTATSFLVTLLLTLVLTFLFLKDGRRFRPLVGRFAGRRVGPHLEEVLARSWSTLGGYIRTQALVSLIDAVLIGIALLVLGVPLAIPLAILTFFGGFIPIIGAFVAGAIAVLVALVSNGPESALIMLAVILGVQQLEGNVLSPWLQSRSMSLPSAVVLLSVTLGSTLFGIVGAFLAVPAVAVAAVVLRFLDEQIAASATDESEPVLTG